jgi:hypothetical protein
MIAVVSVAGEPPADKKKRWNNPLSISCMKNRHFSHKMQRSVIIIVASCYQCFGCIMESIPIGIIYGAKKAPVAWVPFAE